MTQFQRQLRQNIRNFLMVATFEQMFLEHCISVERGDEFRAQVIAELIREDYPERAKNHKLERTA